MFSQQGDKAERGTRRFQASCPGFRQNLYRNDYLYFHRPFSNSRSINCLSATESPSSVIPGFLRFKARRIGWHPCVISAARRIPLRVLPIYRLTGIWSSIVASGRGAPFDADLSATRVCVDGFRLPAGHHFPAAGSSRGYPPGARLAFPRASKHWRALFIEVAADMALLWNFQVA